MKKIPKTLTIKEYISPFCKTKPRDEIVILNDGMGWVTQQLVQQLLPDEKIKSYWGHVIKLDTNEKVCNIEDAYLDALIYGNLKGKVTFGEVTDALEKHLKEN